VDPVELEVAVLLLGDLRVLVREQPPRRARVPEQHRVEHLGAAPLRSVAPQQVQVLDGGRGGGGAVHLGNVFLQTISSSDRNGRPLFESHRQNIIYKYFRVLNKYRGTVQYSTVQYCTAVLLYSIVLLSRTKESKIVNAPMPISETSRLAWCFWIRQKPSGSHASSAQIASIADDRDRLFPTLL